MKILYPFLSAKNQLLKMSELQIANLVSDLIKPDQSDLKLIYRVTTCHIFTENRSKNSTASSLVS